MSSVLGRRTRTGRDAFDPGWEFNHSCLIGRNQADNKGEGVWCLDEPDGGLGVVPISSVLLLIPDPVVPVHG